MIRVEFVGLPSPYADPGVMRALGAPAHSTTERLLRRDMRKELTRQERKRQMQGFARVDGHTRLILGPQHGLSRTYIWGPNAYVVEMDADDIDRLMRMHSHHCLAFRVHPDIVVLRS